MNVLSIQSHVAFGHVGNSAAVFALQRMGHEVWPVHTVHYSNHPGHGRFRGRVATAAEIAEIVEGLDDLGLLARCDAVLTGYMGDAAAGRAALDAVARVRSRNPAAIYLCDPVLGDRETGLYVAEALVDVMRRDALPAADIVMPNLFELELLAGAQTVDMRAVMAAAKTLGDLGPDTVIVTGLGGLTGPDDIGALCMSAERADVIATPSLPIGGRPDGAGDLLAAVFLGRYLDERDAPAALAHAVSAVHGVLRATVENKSRDLCLVAAQAELITPTWQFHPRRIAPA